MLHVIKVVRKQPQLPLSCSFGWKTTSIKSFKVKAADKPENEDNMDDNKKIGDHRDVKSHPFGVAYATRSDEEGFGGTYGGNESPPKSDEEKEKLVHENRSGCEKTQGSGVKEGEKGRHQSDVG